MVITPLDGSAEQTVLPIELSLLPLARCSTDEVIATSKCMPDIKRNNWHQFPVQSETLFFALTCSHQALVLLLGLRLQ